MSTAKTTKSDKKEAFSWDDTNSALAVSRYQEIVAADGIEAANSTGLATISAELGAGSPVKVRSKLVSAGAYQKADKARKVGGGSSVRKAHYVRVFGKHAVEQELIDDADEFASLESVKLDTLENLAKMLGLSDEVKQAAE
ncbi:putative A2 protein [Pectobacterium phage DU_PP_V]|uniref:Putative A2 protein n=1 Tax=Pectobacterium phage DU_PP_V TaxID=2041492 RepID=A0A2D2W6R7_9CAUD|nr:DNA binding protein [Pectobacterium phage DU_PP_V]ATS93989.1 putative A2 protein [Pectobacterium phage DU_PP_V]